MALTVTVSSRRNGKTKALNDAIRDWRFITGEEDPRLNESTPIEEHTVLDTEAILDQRDERTFHPRSLLERLQLAMHNPYGKFAQSRPEIGRQTMYDGSVKAHVIAKRRAANKAAAKARRVHRKAAR